jgi:hypothetical protein
MSISFLPSDEALLGRLGRVVEAAGRLKDARLIGS